MASAALDDPFGLIGTVLDGRLQIHRVVGVGGFAVVYGGMHLHLRNGVAVKVLRIPESLDPQSRHEFVEAFANEARAMVRLEHPAIVRVLDFGVSPLPSGIVNPWMSLEWLDGVTLREDLRARRGHGGRTPTQALNVLRPAFEALAYAHQTGLAHRDVKPGNIVLLSGNRTPGLKILDFGIAKMMEQEEIAGAGMTRTRSRWPAYSIAYAAPEQVVGARTGPWTDVHGLALLMSELLSDRSPYPNSHQESMRAAVDPRRPTPARLGIEAGAWEPIIERALALRPMDRYANAGEFLAALESTQRQPIYAATVLSESPFALAEAVEAARAAALPPTTAPSADATQVVQPPKRRGGIVAGIILLAVLACAAPIALWRLRSSSVRVVSPPVATATHAPSTPTANPAPPITAPSPQPVAAAALDAPITPALAQPSALAATPSSESRDMLDGVQVDPQPTHHHHGRDRGRSDGGTGAASAFTAVPLD